MVNDNMTLGSTDVNLVTSLLTKGNNFNIITVDTTCMGCYKPQKVDSLCQFTYLCPVTSANEFSNAHMGTKGPNTSKMLCVDGDKVLQITSAAQCPDIENRESDRELGTLEPSDSALDDVLPNTF